MWGAADQGRVNIPILESLESSIVAFVDDTPELSSPRPDIPILRGWAGLETWISGQNISQLGFVLAIGNPYGHVRQSLSKKLSDKGLAVASFADPSALLCASSMYGDGLQVMPAVVVNNDARIGSQCILNTRALVEHDCVLEAGVEIGPGAILCGRVHVGENSWIGAGAIIRPRVIVGRNVIVGAGAVVVADIPDNCVAVGVPAHPVFGKTTPSSQA